MKIVFFSSFFLFSITLEKAAAEPHLLIRLDCDNMHATIMVEIPREARDDQKFKITLKYWSFIR
jgi:hypothetical protein